MNKTPSGEKHGAPPRTAGVRPVKPGYVEDWGWPLFDESQQSNRIHLQFCHMAMDQYLLIPFLVGYSHPFYPSYFDVNYRGTYGFDTLPYRYLG